MADDGNVSDFVDDMDEEYYGGGGEDAGLDDYDMLTKVTDTSSCQAKKGKDIQGIPWERLNITRESYRLTRVEQYRNYENIPLSGEAVDKECKQMEKGGNYYEFFYNSRLVKPTILHFQLRNLVWATSKHDVYLMSNYSVMHWSSITHNLSEVLNFSGHIAPTEKHAGSLLEGFTQTQISSLAVQDNFLVAGGFQGELACKDIEFPIFKYTMDEKSHTNIWYSSLINVEIEPEVRLYAFVNFNYYPREYPYRRKAKQRRQGSTPDQFFKFLIRAFLTNYPFLWRLDKPGVSFCTRTTYEDNAITNALDVYDSISGGIHFMASNNDCGVREYDMERFQLMNHFRFPWPVNHTSMSPDRKLFTVVGDHLDSLLVDSRNGKTVASAVGHLDYSFASAWHPDGFVFATGNQDKTCRVWDLRNLSLPIATLKKNMGAVRSIRFSSDGQFLVVAEPADFVHLYSTKADYKKRQEIDFFGEISGVSLSPDDETLYIGVWDRTYASLLQYNRRQSYGRVFHVIFPVEETILAIYRYDDQDHTDNIVTMLFLIKSVHILLCLNCVISKLVIFEMCHFSSQ
ncbi:unnamed protein product [Ilex paraguariensis]|uniref:Uncharacterized protein n=1 Tax=Ilex paraguariensis TaxID=185542 RepID=A0ABC8RBM2_9AQUA